MAMLSSRNTVLMFAFLFLLMVIVLRVSVNFIGENIIRVLDSIFAGNVDNLKLLDFSTIDWGKYNPKNMEVGELKARINGRVHEIVDMILPALIYTVNMIILQSAFLFRSKTLSAMVHISRVPFFI